MKIENFMKKILSISPYSFSHTQIISIFAAQLIPLLTSLEKSAETRNRPMVNINCYTQITKLLHLLKIWLIY